MRSRLPERLSGKVQPLAVEVAVGVALPILLALARLAIVPWTGEFAPYALVFVGVVLAAVLAGWLSGLLALVIGQFLVWYIVLDPEWTLEPKGSHQIAALVLASISELIALVIIALYQREVEQGWAQRDSHVGLLQKAQAEIDHRTANNYQTVLALVLAQAKSADSQAVKQALQQVVDRIRAIANASRKLAVASEGLKQVRIADHLQDLCQEIERGLARPEVSLQCQFDDLVLGADQTVCVSILINELVTNALKHAFPDDREGVIKVSLTRARSGLELKVEDNGIGIKASGKSRGTGLGTRLVETFAGQMRARHEVATDAGGTRHRIRIPG